ncbi:MAG: DMT family transporter [Candidatus Dormibacteraeota bacterium]|nr:DMT family transporter [Candidatus Dormibacteraeota bacterium]
MDRDDYLLLAILAAMWGASFLFIKIAVREITPVSMVCLRTLAAALALGLYLRLTHVPLRGALRLWKPGLVIAVLNAALPYTLIATGEKYINSSLAGILNATAPLWTAILAPLFAEAEQFHPRQGLGLAMGFAGVVILAHPTGSLFSSNFLGAMAVIAATLAYAIATHYSVRHFQGVPAQVPAFLQCAGAAVLLAPLVLVSHPSRMPSLGALASTLWLGVAATGVAMVISFRLIQRVGASRTMVVTYLIPPSALFWGVVFLHERPSPAVFVALVLILGGVFFITRKRASPAKVAPEGVPSQA